MPNPLVPNYEGLFLGSRDQVETAWQAAAITGLAPSIEPMLSSMVNLPWSKSDENQDLLRIAIPGETGKKYRRELISSLELVTDIIDESSPTVRSAQALLELLREED